MSFSKAASSSSSEDEEDSSDDSPSAFFSGEKPSNNRHWWLLPFYQYLPLPDCERKRSKNRLQHASHIRTIIEYLDPKGNDIKILAADEGYTVWTDFVDPKMDVLKGVTIHSYLGSCETFLQFATTERAQKGLVPELDEDSLRIFRNLIPRLNGWRHTVLVEKNIERTSDILHECDTHLTNEDAEQFLQSDLLANSKDIFKKAALGEMLGVCE